MNNHRGMTLLEVVVAFAIIATISVAMLMGFRLMMAITLQADQANQTDLALETHIAKDGAGSWTTGAAIQSIDIPAAGKTWRIPGAIRIYQQDGRRFQVFVPE